MSPYFAHRLAGPGLSQRLTVVYVGADDCAPCRTWHHDDGPQFFASAEFRRVDYREIRSRSLLGVLDEDLWPADLRTHRDLVKAAAGVPLWLLLVDDDVAVVASGISKWRELMLPAIRRLAR